MVGKDTGVPFFDTITGIGMAGALPWHQDERGGTIRDEYHMGSIPYRHHEP
jgi:hypothetical protein